MQAIFCFLVLLFLSLTTRAQHFSAYDWATCYATKRTTAITIDGNLGDWAGVKGFSMDQEKYFFVGQGMSSCKWKGVNDLYAHCKVQWDDLYIYIAVEVWDDRVMPAHGALQPNNSSGSWDDDGVEIMFDHDGCGKSRYYIGDSMHHEYHFVYDDKTPYVFDNFWIPDAKAAQPMFTLPNGELEALAYAGEALMKNDVTAGFTGPPYAGDYRFKRTAKGYNLEIKMKLAGTQLKAVNAGGHAIGFDIAINDNDEGRGPLKQQLHWSGMNGPFWRDCKYFGTLILLQQ